MKLNPLPRLLVQSLGATLLIGNSCADVIITENTVTGVVRVQGGGGSSPVVIGPITQSASNSSGVSLTNSQSVHGIATDALNGYRGEASGDGVAGATTYIGGSTWEISATGLATADFTALPDLGVGGADSDTKVAIRFTVTDPVNYTFNGELTGDVTATDTIRLQRLNPPFAPATLEFVYTAQNPVVGATGNLIAADYQILIAADSNSSGGEAQSPGSKSVFFSMNLDLSPDPTVTPTIITGFEELTIRDYAYDEDDNPYLTFDSLAGVKYRVKTSPNAQDPWDGIPGASIIASGGLATIGFPLSPDPECYYKVVRITPY